MSALAHRPVLVPAVALMAAAITAVTTVALILLLLLLSGTGAAGPTGSRTGAPAAVPLLLLRGIALAIALLVLLLLGTVLAPAARGLGTGLLLRRRCGRGLLLRGHRGANRRWAARSRACGGGRR